jgi:high affinity sulfate transporter 1
MSSITIDNLFPGLIVARNYKREWLTRDLVAGVSVAAVALPIGIAYAQLAGFPPVIGIYSSIFPPLAYAVFGSSRQLIVNPDAAACAIVASTVTPLAAGVPEHYLDLAIALTLITGVLCIAGGLAGLGAIANFLSKPILTGYLNGIALSIIVGQLGKLLGFTVAAGGFFKTFAAVVERVGETQITTAILGISLLILALALKYLLPRVPGPLIAAAIAVVMVYFFGLSNKGVAVVGAVPAGLPVPRIPLVDTNELPHLFFGACGIVLVSFCSMMTTARGFAAKNGYSINANQDMAALGACDIASGLFRGFVVSGADSRTAVADSSGGKSQMTGIVAALVMVIVLLFLTGPLAYVPSTALAAILITSALGLFDVRSLGRYYKLSKPEFRQSIIAMLGVMTIGVLPGVLIAVALALFNLVRRASRPNDAVLGLVEGTTDVFAENETSGGRDIPGLII